jgi:hypothetical protein
LTCTDVIGAVSRQTTCPHSIRTVAGHLTCTDVIGAVCCQTTCPHSIRTVAGHLTCTDVISAVSRNLGSGGLTIYYT